jgi:hypothetical protein
MSLKLAHILFPPSQSITSVRPKRTNYWISLLKCADFLSCPKNAGGLSPCANSLSFSLLFLLYDFTDDNFSPIVCHAHRHHRLVLLQSVSVSVLHKLFELTQPLFQNIAVKPHKQLVHNVRTGFVFRCAPRGTKSASQAGSLCFVVHLCACVCIVVPLFGRRDRVACVRIVCRQAAISGGVSQMRE